MFPPPHVYISYHLLFDIRNTERQASSATTIMKFLAPLLLVITALQNVEAATWYILIPPITHSLCLIIRLGISCAGIHQALPLNYKKFAPSFS